MSLQKWLEYGWLRPHQSSRKEISDLLRIIDRDLQDAAGDISADWRFGIAYNAAPEALHHPDLCGRLPSRLNSMTDSINAELRP